MPIRPKGPQAVRRVPPPDQPQLASQQDTTDRHARLVPGTETTLSSREQQADDQHGLEQKDEDKVLSGKGQEEFGWFSN